MNHVFLSHSSKDQDATHKLYEELMLLGFKVWYDEVEMEPGDSFVAKIGSAIRSSMNLAVVLSENSIRSRWVQKEVSVAITGQLSGAQVRVIPIRIDNAELPPFISDVNCVDFREAAKEKERLEFGRLVKMLMGSESRLATLLRLVSANAHASATGQYAPGAFGPSHVLAPSDETSRESPTTYWLTPEGEGGSITLKLHRAYPIRLVRVLNTQNRIAKDRAARLAAISFRVSTEPEYKAWQGAIPKYPTWLNLSFDSVLADCLTLEVIEWEGRGGGLNCIEMYSED